MAAIEAIVVVTAVGFAFMIVVVVIVIIGVRQEERYLTLKDRVAPTVAAQLARMILGRYVRRERAQLTRPVYPDDLAGHREDAVGPRS